MDKRLMADLMPLFAGLNNTELEALAGILELRSVRKKQMVVSEGEVCHDMVYVRKGLLRQFYFKNGREITEHFTCEGNIAYYECKVCHELFKDADAAEGIEKEDTVVAKKAHTPETIPGKAATCTETGLTEGSKCSVCGTILEEQEVISAKGHTLAVAAVTTEPTAEADLFYCRLSCKWPLFPQPHSNHGRPWV